VYNNNNNSKRATRIDSFATSGEEDDHTLSVIATETAAAAASTSKSYPHDFPVVDEDPDTDTYHY